MQLHRELLLWHFKLKLCRTSVSHFLAVRLMLFTFTLHWKSCQSSPTADISAHYDSKVKFISCFLQLSLTESEGSIQRCVHNMIRHRGGCAKLLSGWTRFCFYFHFNFVSVGMCCSSLICPLDGTAAQATLMIRRYENCIQSIYWVNSKHRGCDTCQLWNRQNKQHVHGFTHLFNI